jgi:signal-transduction protein with cAMP-binding, CBS, and nucleotidyltransferase domain
MISADMIDRMAALAAVPPFDRLSGRELLLVAEHVRPRSFDPGAVLIEARQVADMLYVVAGGSAMVGDRLAPLLFDAPSLLFTLPADREYRAGADGLRALCLAKPHLFTIARECPEFIAGLVDIQAIVR